MVKEKKKKILNLRMRERERKRVWGGGGGRWGLGDRENVKDRQKALIIYVAI